MNLLLHRAKGPSSRELSDWFEWSNRTIDRRRKKGQQLQHLFEQMNRTENPLQHTTSTDELRWAELFRQSHAATRRTRERERRRRDAETLRGEESLPEKGVTPEDLEALSEPPAIATPSPAPGERNQGAVFLVPQPALS